MSTPFPLEEQAQEEPGQPLWNPWGKPTPMSLGAQALRSPYTVVESIGSAAAKGEQVLAGSMVPNDWTDPETTAARGADLSENDLTPSPEASKQMEAVRNAAKADARERIKDLTPDPQTTGVATQVLHGLGEGLATVAVAGPAGPAGAFGALATTQGYGARQDLLEQGVDSATATKVGVVRGLLAGAGGVTPMAFGAGLLPKLATSAASNVSFGITGRAIDSHILRSAGFDQMADQEQTFDRTQLLIDLALGAGFGAWAHIHASLAAPLAEASRAPDAGGATHPNGVAALSDAMQRDSLLRDAALTANLALKDRRSGPGVAVDPASAQAHDAALEQAVRALQDDAHVNVAGSGVEDSRVVLRDGQENPAVSDLLVRQLHESGVLEEQAKLEALEATLGRKLAGVPEPEQLADTLQHSVDADGVHTVRSPNGFTTAKQRGDTLQVLDTQTTEGTQGKGEGTARIGKLADVAAAHALTLTSDTKVSDAAAKVYDRLEKQGYQVTRHPGESDGEGNQVSTAGRPLFEVRPPPETLEQRIGRDPDLRQGLAAMKGETGWAQEGGRVLMDETGKVTGRTTWIPHQEWWRDRPKGLNETQVHKAVDKALAGQPLGKRETAIVSFMKDVHDERVQRAGIAQELEQVVPELASQPKEAVDLTVLTQRAMEFDTAGAAKVLDSWADDSPETLARVQDELERIVGRGHENALLESQTAGAEEPARAARPGGHDLFGETPSAQQRLADEQRRRDLARSPERDVSAETGRPDDLFSQARQQVDLADAIEDTRTREPAGRERVEQADGLKVGDIVRIKDATNPENGNRARILSIFRYERDQPFNFRVSHEAGGQEALPAKSLELLGQLDLTTPESPFAQPLAGETKGAPGATKEAGGATKGAEGETSEVPLRLAEQAIAERPDLAISTQQGTVSGADQLRATTEELKQTEKSAPTLMKSAADCFLRKGP